jgi:hypothetical protein
MRYATGNPHRTLHAPKMRAYLLRHGDTHRWYLCRDVLHCVPLTDLLRRPLRFLAWWHDGRVR